MLLLEPSKMLSRSNCILILVMSHVANCVPLKPRKRLPSEAEQGFSASPRILEIQLPLKIASREDLSAWSKYVISLLTSTKNNSTGPRDVSPLGTQERQQVSSYSKPRETTRKEVSLSDKRHPARKLKAPQRPDDKVVAYPLPIAGVRNAAPNPFDVPIVPSHRINKGAIEQQYLQYSHNAPYGSFGNENLLQQSHANTLVNTVLAQQQPAATYLPLPTRTGAYQKTVSENVSSFREPAKLQSTNNSFNFHINTINDESRALPIAVGNGLTGDNLSYVAEPLLAFPFQAFITISRQQAEDAKTQSNEYFAHHARNPPDEFPPYFEKNYTIEQAIFNDVSSADTSSKRVKEERRKQDENKKQQQGARANSVKSEKQKKQKSSKPSTFSDLLRMLGILKRPSKNATEVSVATPILSILKGTNSQKTQVTFEETPPNEEKYNGTFEMSQAQVNDDDDDEEEDDEDDDDEDEEGGFIQTIIETLPLVAPLLEDLSDPNVQLDIPDLLRTALPLIMDFSDPNQDGGFDIPGIVLPIAQRLSINEDGQLDSAAILGPLIQVAAPIIGPVLGPLIGPLSQTISGGGGGSASIITALAGPLSEPRGPYGQSILSTLIAGITAGLSKELAIAADNSDVKSLVSTLVSAVLAGTSSGLSGHKHHKPYGPHNYTDTYHAPTTYDNYHMYYKPASKSFTDVLNEAIGQILGAFLKLSATSTSSGANLSASSSSSSTSLSTSSLQGSSQDQGHHPGYGGYGVPAYSSYSSPPRPTYTSTNSPYAPLYARRQTKPIKKV